MSDGPLAGLVLAYAALLAGGSWVVERVSPSSAGRANPGSSWARDEAARFRRGMARTVRAVAAFLVIAVLVRSWETAWTWPALVLLAVVASADIRTLKGAPVHTPGDDHGEDARPDRPPSSARPGHRSPRADAPAGTAGDGTPASRRSSSRPTPRVRRARSGR